MHDNIQRFFMSNKFERFLWNTIESIPGCYILAAFMLVLWGIVTIQGNTPSILWIESRIGETGVGIWRWSLMFFAWVVARHNQPPVRAVLWSFPVLLYMAALLTYALNVPSASASAGAALGLWAYGSTVIGMYLRNFAVTVVHLQIKEVANNAIPEPTTPER